MVIIPFVFMPGAPRKGSIQHALAPQTRHFYLAETRHFNLASTPALLNLGMYGLVLRCFGFSDFRYISTGKAAELSTGYPFFGALPVAHRQPRFLLRFDATGFHLRSLSCRPVVARSAAR
jgi:hypothetical protein